jgi:hypothetical protein
MDEYPNLNKHKTPLPHQLPLHFLARPQRYQLMLTKPNRCWHLPFFFAQSDALNIARQSIKVRAVKTRKTF